MNYSERAKQRREKLKADGLCIDCGKNQVNLGVRCESCCKAQRERNQKWGEKNRDILRAKNKEWYQENKVKFRQYGKEYRFRLRSLVVEQLGGKCECCGETQLEWLQIDHQNNDGKKHRQEVGRGKDMMLDILRNPGKYKVRVLCANCHNAVTCYGYCPHTISKVSQDVSPSLVEGCDFR